MFRPAHFPLVHIANELAFSFESLYRVTQEELIVRATFALNQERAFDEYLFSHGEINENDLEEAYNKQCLKLVSGAGKLCFACGKACFANNAVPPFGIISYLRTNILSSSSCP